MSDTKPIKIGLRAEMCCFPVVKAGLLPFDIETGRPLGRVASCIIHQSMDSATTATVTLHIEGIYDSNGEKVGG